MCVRVGELPDAAVLTVESPVALFTIWTQKQGLIQLVFKQSSPTLLLVLSVHITKNDFLITYCGSSSGFAIPKNWMPAAISRPNKEKVLVPFCFLTLVN